MINSYLLRFHWEYAIVFYKNSYSRWIFFLILLFCFVFNPFNFKLNLLALEILKLGEWQRRGQKVFFFIIFPNNINKSQILEQQQYQQEQNTPGDLEWPSFHKLWGHFHEGGGDAQHYALTCPAHLSYVVLTNRKHLKLGNPRAALLCCVWVGTLGDSTKIFHSWLLLMTCILYNEIYFTVKRLKNALLISANEKA